MFGVTTACVYEGGEYCAGKGGAANSPSRHRPPVAIGSPATWSFPPRDVAGSPARTQKSTHAVFTLRNRTGGACSLVEDTYYPAALYNYLEPRLHERVLFRAR